MQALVRDVTQMSWRAMLGPMVPGVLCAALIVVVLRGVDMAVRASVAAPPAWLLLGTQSVAGAIFYAAYILLTPFASVRSLLVEFRQDVLPARPFNLLNWRRRTAPNV
jgi:hypothetical protein